MAKTMKPQIIFDFYNTVYNPKTEQLFRGIPSLLTQLKLQYQLILITTYSPDRKKQLSQSKLNQYFSKIIICPQKSSLVFKRFARDSTTIVIGDRQEEEINIAQALGLQFIKVSPKLENPVETIRKKLLREGLI